MTEKTLNAIRKIAAEMGDSVWTLPTQLYRGSNGTVPYIANNRLQQQVESTARSVPRRAESIIKPFTNLLKSNNNDEKYPYNVSQANVLEKGLDKQVTDTRKGYKKFLNYLPNDMRTAVDHGIRSGIKTISDTLRNSNTVK